MLIHDEENDYTLPRNEPNCWITVRNLSVYIQQYNEGVTIKIFSLHNEMDDYIAITGATFEQCPTT